MNAGVAVNGYPKSANDNQVMSIDVGAFIAEPPPGVHIPTPDEEAEEQRRQDEENASKKAPPPARLGTHLDGALVRAHRRATGREKPVPLPFPTLLEHFGGGLWAGVHFLVAGTGLGKTQIGLQIGLHAARAGVPVLYVGLELEPMQIALRTLGDASGVPWSKLYTGDAAPTMLDRASRSVDDLADLPFHVEFGRPNGWPLDRITELGQSMRAAYPEEDGAGSRPILVVLDFLQLVGDPEGESLEIRNRISLASYRARSLGADLNITCLVISSVSREARRILADAVNQAGFTYEEDEHGRPIKRRILAPDALQGLGKESGDIEYSADTLSVMVKEPATYEPGGGVDVVFATVKARAQRETWSPLHFTGFAFHEPEDRGGRLVSAWKAKDDARTEAKEQRKQAKEDAKHTKLVSDAAAVASYVLANPGCTVRAARLLTVANKAARWEGAKAILGAALTLDKGLALDPTKLPDEVSACLTKA